MPVGYIAVGLPVNPVQSKASPKKELKAVSLSRPLQYFSAGDMKRRRGACVTSPRVGRLLQPLCCRRCLPTRLQPRTAANCPCLPNAQAGSKDVSKLDALFNAYRDKSSEEDVIGPEGETGGKGGRKAGSCPADPRSLAEPSAGKRQGSD